MDGFVRALDAFESVVAGVPPGRWDAPSPCEGWCAADVAGHVIIALRAIENRAAGHPEADGPADPRTAAGDLAQATGQAVVLDPGLVREALATAQQFAPAGRAAGLIGPERPVPAGDLTRLLALFGRAAG